MGPRDAGVGQDWSQICWGGPGWVPEMLGWAQRDAEVGPLGC